MIMTIDNGVNNNYKYLFHSVAGRHNRVHEEDLSPRNVFRELGIYHMSLMGICITFNKYFTYADGTAAITETLKMFLNISMVLLLLKNEEYIELKTCVK